MRLFVLTVSASVLWASASAATPIDKAIVVAENGALAPYDAGYATQASVSCPNVTLLIPIGPEAQQNSEFKRGVAMFDRYVSIQKLEGACKAALNLYDEKTGKAAKLLGRK